MFSRIYLNLSYLRLFVCAAFVTTFFYSLPLADETPSKHTVAILELSGTKESGLSLQEKQTLAEVVRGIARKQLRNSEWIILTRENIMSRVPPGTDLSDCGGDECIITTGKKLAVDYIVSGAATLIGSYIQVTLSMYDVASGDLKSSEWARGKTVDDLINPVENTAEKLFASLPGARSMPANEQPEFSSVVQKPREYENAPPSVAPSPPVRVSSAPDSSTPVSTTRTGPRPTRFGLGIHYSGLTGDGDKTDLLDASPALGGGVKLFLLDVFGFLDFEAGVNVNFKDVSLLFSDGYSFSSQLFEAGALLPLHFGSEKSLSGRIYAGAGAAYSIARDQNDLGESKQQKISGGYFVGGISFIARHIGIYFNGKVYFLSSPETRMYMGENPTLVEVGIPFVF